MNDWETTLRILLDEQGFDWDTGIIVAKNNGDIVEIDRSNKELDHIFEKGYAASWNITEAIFSDARYIYVIQVYDGAPSLVKIPKDIREFLSLSDEEKKGTQFFIGGGW